MSPSPPELPASIYLAGPMTGIPEYNFPAFQLAAADLRGRGIDVWSPAEHDLANGFDPATDAAKPLRHYMEHDLPAVLASDAVVVLPGWEDSKGARLEVHTATACDIPVLSYPLLAPLDIRVIIGRHTETSWGQGTGVLDAADSIWRGEPSYTRVHGRLWDAAPADGTFAKDAWLDGMRDYFKAPVGRELGLVTDGMPDLSEDMRQHVVTNAITGGQKETRPARMDLLPWDQLWTVAELYAYGAQKYEDRNWERGYAYSLSIAAMLRHAAKFVQGENDDPESGCPHLASVVFHALALMRFVSLAELNELPLELDDRPVMAGVRAREDAR